MNNPLIAALIAAVELEYDENQISVANHADDFEMFYSSQTS